MAIFSNHLYIYAFINNRPTFIFSPCIDHLQWWWNSQQFNDFFLITHQWHTHCIHQGWVLQTNFLHVLSSSFFRTIKTLFTCHPLSRWIYFRKHKIHLQFQFHFSTLTEMMLVIKSVPCGSEASVYPLSSIPWLLMAWRRKEPGHQQPWYWPTSSTGCSSTWVNIIVISDRCHI